MSLPEAEGCAEVKFGGARRHVRRRVSTSQRRDGDEGIPRCTEPHFTLLYFHIFHNPD